ncbi:hypothetical protein Q8A67_025597 [Cirrhinus molitorella]|uniref:Uncharacterized protein n=1 Tax=Cirrhinus molitorella TaxID=172907 RepID=A0AA88THY7_9TELE|nr:hypothetical protein Q8A67_025597 [Cirrhinus molitorella]
MLVEGGGLSWKAKLESPNRPAGSCQKESSFLAHYTLVTSAGEWLPIGAQRPTWRAAETLGNRANGDTMCTLMSLCDPRQ